MIKEFNSYQLLSFVLIAVLVFLDMQYVPVDGNFVFFTFPFLGVILILFLVTIVVITPALFIVPQFCSYNK